MTIKRQSVKFSGIRSVGASGAAPSAHGDRKPHERGPLSPALHTKKAKKTTTSHSRRTSSGRKKSTKKKSTTKRTYSAIAHLTDKEWVVFLTGLILEVVGKSFHGGGNQSLLGEFDDAFESLYTRLWDKYVAPRKYEEAELVIDGIQNNSYGMRAVFTQFVLQIVDLELAAQQAQQQQPGNYQRLGGF